MNAFELTPKEALEKVVAHLQYQQYEYNNLPAEQRKGHIWEAVQVLQKELTREPVRKSALEQIRETQTRAAIRKVEGLRQGY